MGSAVKIIFTGLEQFKAKVEETNERVKKALGAGLYMAANNIMTDAKEIVPLDVGTLQGSGYVTLPEETRAGPVVELGFGGPAGDYAVIQHEDQSIRHSEPGRGAKYLERAIDKHSGNLASDIAEFAKRALEANQGARKTSTPTDPNQAGLKRVARAFGRAFKAK